VVGGSRDAIFTEGADALIVGNNVSQSGSGYAGIYASGIRTRIRGNEVYNAYNAMYVNGIAPSTLTDRLEVTGNLVHHNSYSGIYGRYRTLISGNTVWGQTASSGRGIQVEYGATAQENEVFDNTLGINLYDSCTVQGNRVYRNSTTGIRMSQGGSVIGNTVYSNSIGLEASDYGSHVVTNNLVYANTNQGIRVAVSNTQTEQDNRSKPSGWSNSCCRQKPNWHWPAHHRDRFHWVLCRTSLFLPRFVNCESGRTTGWTSATWRDLVVPCWRG
ncbi:MAG: right-handed parallel beta-helix repeat-containing protein, partial [Planctomycetaceae bacterium]